MIHHDLDLFYDILQLIVFYFHQRHFHIQYKFYFKHYLLLLYFTNYSIFNCFSLFFLSKKIFEICNCTVILFFFTLKIFLISLIMLSSLRLKHCIIIYHKKKAFWKNKSLLYFLRKHKKDMKTFLKEKSNIIAVKFTTIFQL